MAATVENRDYTARFARLLEDGADRWAAMEQVARLATELKGFARPVRLLEARWA